MLLVQLPPSTWKRESSLRQLLDDTGESLRPRPCLEAFPDPMLHDRLDRGEILFAKAERVEIFEVLRDVHRRRGRAAAFLA